MPGADLPPNINPSDPTPSTDSHPLEANESSAHRSHSPEEEWETVNLPNAISVDQLPVTPENNISEVVEEKFALEEVEIQPGESENPSQLIQALHECNRDLINRVTELEIELDECRKALHNQDSLFNQRVQELAIAQDQVTRLFGKLELSNQVIRRQQVLVETLTQQWETSQTRMAQMERECALAQQRYNEQFHELVEAQNACRELRSRLHRQQRHTLQFKAALERCLEMQPRQQPNDQHNQPKTYLNLPKIEQTSPGEDPRESLGLELDSPPIAVSRSQPVQPWSAESTDDNNSVERLDEIVRQEQHLDHFDEEMVSEWLELDEQIPPHLQNTPDDLSQQDYWRENQPSLAASQLSELPNLGELENYWYPDDSGETPLTSNPFVETSESEFESESESVESTPVQSSPQFIEDELDRIRMEYASSTIPSFELDSGKSGFIPFPDQPLDQLHRGSQPQQTVSSTSKTSNWPAPLLQPTRQKKLRSLARVELPRFSQSSPVDQEVMASNSEGEPF
ncbi:hypothetical protein [Lyngbya sp. PCC 8106]|uniref:hypothetical protein n=1 Tax=Lyngbya sp. (strain PCC 8106) TaxID=313612 RepID=UPI0000EAA203|nr:hypothetical protein [Lyngbya sp. PCC 8106]EAW37743.1 hypothetical protein L8106_17307 [Lyngbya sp. PCC 8106]